MDTLNPPAVVKTTQDAAALLAQARAVDAEILLTVGQAVEGMRKRGELLKKAKEAAGHGNFAAVLKQHWPTLLPRTAQRWMQAANTSSMTYLNSAIRAVTHPEGDPSDDPEKTSGETTSPLLCDRCKRVGAIRDCPQCAEVQAGKREGDRRPSGGSRPSAPSPPAPPAQPKLDLDPKATEAEEQDAGTRRQLVTARQTIEAAHLAVRECMKGLAGDELRRLLRLAKLRLIESDDTPQAKVGDIATPLREPERIAELDSLERLVGTAAGRRYL